MNRVLLMESFFCVIKWNSISYTYYEGGISNMRLLRKKGVPIICMMVMLLLLAPHSAWGVEEHEVTGDVTPPTTYSNVSYQLGNHYYKYTDDETVEVTLTAVDDMSGVFETMYRINSDVWQSYSGTIVLTEEGEYLLEYYSKD